MFLQRTLEKRKICIKIIDQIDKIHYFLLSCGFENQGCDNKRSASSKESHVLSNEDVFKVLRWHVRYPIYWTSQLNLCAIVSVDRSQLSKFLRSLNFQRLSLCYPCFQTDRPPLSELSRLSSAAITFCLLRSVQGLDQPLLLTHGQIYKHKHTDIHTQSHAEMYRNIHRSTLSLIYMYAQYHTLHISDIWLQWQIF